MQHTVGSLDIGLIMKTIRCPSVSHQPICIAFATVTDATVRDLRRPARDAVQDTTVSSATGARKGETPPTSDGVILTSRGRAGAAGRRAAMRALTHQQTEE